MHRFFIVSFMILWGFLLEADSQPKTITIFHTNDMHAAFVPHEAFWIKENPKPMVGGFQELCFTVDSLRRLFPRSILLDAGDMMTGNPVTEYQYHGVFGGALFELMNMTGYDAWCPGNHDFDVSQENLAGLTKIARFPTVEANLVNKNGIFPPTAVKSKIFSVDGIRVGVIGIMTQELYGLVNQNNLTGLRVLPPAAELQKMIDELDPQTDLIIALTHQGDKLDEKLAQAVTGVDVIVGGHSHTRIKTPRSVNGVLIVQAGSNIENLGVLKLTVENDAVTSHSGELIQLWQNSAHPKSRVTRFIDSIRTTIDKAYSEVIATLDGEWVRREGNSALTNFIADAQKEEAKADVGFMNNAGVRQNVSAGPLTKKELFEVMPFRNVLTTFQLSGTEVRAIVEYSLLKKSSIHVSGIKARYKRNGDSVEFVSFEINGKPLDEKKAYIGAGSDYLMGEAKRYLGIEVQNVHYSNTTVFAAAEKKAREMKVIIPKDEYRIEEVR